MDVREGEHPAVVMRTPGATWSGRWSNGHKVERMAVRPDGQTLALRIEVGPITVDDVGGVVADDGPVQPTDTTILVGGTRHWADTMGGQVSLYDLWLTDARGEGSRLLAAGTFGGDLRP